MKTAFLLIFPIVCVSVSVYGQQDVFGTFSHVKTIAEPDPDIVRKDYGTDMALYGDVLIVSAANYPSEGSMPKGAVYVFDRNHNGNGNWGLIDFENYPLTNVGGIFGRSLAVYEDTFVVSHIGGDQGRILAYEQNSDGTWDYVQSIEPPNPGVETHDFGFSVSIHGDVMATGEPHASVDGGGISGIIRIFERTSNESSPWQYVEDITIDDDAQYATFGNQVFLYDDVLDASAQHKDGTFSVFVFERQNNQWTK